MTERSPPHSPLSIPTEQTAIAWTGAQASSTANIWRSVTFAPDVGTDGRYVAVASFGPDNRVRCSLLCVWLGGWVWECTMPMLRRYPRERGIGVMHLTSLSSSLPHHPPTRSHLPLPYPTLLSHAFKNKPSKPPNKSEPKFFLLHSLQTNR